MHKHLPTASLGSFIFVRVKDFHSCYKVATRPQEEKFDINFSYLLRTVKVAYRCTYLSHIVSSSDTFPFFSKRKASVLQWKHFLCAFYLFVSLFKVSYQSLRSSYGENTDVGVLCLCICVPVCFLGVWAFLWFVCFCLLTNQWSHTQDTRGIPVDAARATVAFSFFSVATWVSILRSLKITVMLLLKVNS